MKEILRRLLLIDVVILIPSIFIITTFVHQPVIHWVLVTGVGGFCGVMAIQGWGFNPQPKRPVTIIQRTAPELIREIVAWMQTAPGPERLKFLLLMRAVVISHTEDRCTCVNPEIGFITARCLSCGHTVTEPNRRVQALEVRQ